MVRGDEIYGAIDANLEELISRFTRIGHGNLTLNFDKERWLWLWNLKPQMRKWSTETVNFPIKLSLPMDAVFTMGFAVNMMKMIDFTQREILPELVKN